MILLMVHIFLCFTCLYLHWGSFDQLSREDQYFAVTYDELYFLNFLYATRTCNYDISAYNLQLDQNMFYSIFFNFIRVHVNISVLWNIYFVNYVVNNDQNFRPEIKADITLTVCSQNEKKLKP